MNMNMFRILLFFVLPPLALLLFPPDLLLSAPVLVLVVIVLMLLLGWMLWRGSPRALTLAIFIQGLNAIVRMMLFYPHSKPAGEPVQWAFLITSLLSMALSTYIILLMDRPEVRIQMA